MENKNFKAGEKIKVSDKASDLMHGMEIALRGALGAYLKACSKDVVEIIGGVHNTVLTVVGKMYADLIVLGAIDSKADIEKTKNIVLKLLGDEIMNQYKIQLEESKEGA